MRHFSREAVHDGVAMKIFRTFRRWIAAPTMVLVLALFLPSAATRAAMVSTELLLASPPVPELAVPESRDELLDFLQRTDVQAEMAALGVDVDEAIARVEVMSDEEVAQIAGRLEELPAGGHIVGIVVGSVVFVFLVLLLTDILCLTSIFPFTHCIGGGKK